MARPFQTITIGGGSAPPTLGGGLGFMAPPLMTFKTGGSTVIQYSDTMVSATGAPTAVVAATNADTTYGLDQSDTNNYGLGTSYVSPALMSVQAAQGRAIPSIWWLVLALFIVAVWA